MGENLLKVLKFSVSGIVVGTVASFVCDQLNGVLKTNFAPVTGISNAGMYGRTVFDIVVVGGMAAVVIYGGDQFITTFIGDDDPLYRIFYSMIAFNMCGATFQGAKELKSMLNSLVSSSSSSKPNMPAHKASNSSPNGGSANAGVALPSFNQSIMSNRYACQGSCPNI